MTIPSIVRPIPRALFIVFSDALLANLEVRRAAIRVKVTQKNRIEISEMPPPIAKWETEPVSAVNVIIKTLVPTALFNSYPRTLTSIISIIMPPPAPTTPQIIPITAPETIDWIIAFVLVLSLLLAFASNTGRKINLRPTKSVINIENPPIVA